MAKDIDGVLGQRFERMTKTGKSYLKGPYENKLGSVY